MKVPLLITIASIVLAGTSLGLFAQDGNSDESTFIVRVLDREIDLFDENYNVIGSIRRNDLEKIMTVPHPNPEESGSVLPIIESDNMLGMHKISVPSEYLTIDATEAWVTRGDVIVYPPPIVCENSLRGQESTTQRQVTIGIGGC